MSPWPGSPGSVWSEALPWDNARLDPYDFSPTMPMCLGHRPETGHSSVAVLVTKNGCLSVSTHVICICKYMWSMNTYSVPYIRIYIYIHTYNSYHIYIYIVHIIYIYVCDYMCDSIRCNDHMQTNRNKIGWRICRRSTGCADLVLSSGSLQPGKATSWGSGCHRHSIFCWHILGGEHLKVVVWQFSAAG